MWHKNLFPIRQLSNLAMPYDHAPIYTLSAYKFSWELNRGNKSHLVCRSTENVESLLKEVKKSVSTSGLHKWYNKYSETKSFLACNETNMSYCLLSVYSVTTTLHVLGLLAAHHQELALYTCDSLYVLYVLVKTVQHVLTATSWWWATSKPETCRGVVTE
jgi:hypothetical protein